MSNRRDMLKKLGITNLANADGETRGFLRGLITEFIKNFKKFRSLEAQEYFYNLIAAIMLEHHKAYESFDIQVPGRLKSPKRIFDKVLDYLSKDEDDVVRFEVARNESTLSETLAYLSGDKHPVIRRNVAINKNTLPETPELLSEETHDFGIKYFVAHNPNTPEEVREHLIRILPQNAWAQTPSIEMLRNYYDNEDDDWD